MLSVIHLHLYDIPTVNETLPQQKTASFIKQQAIFITKDANQHYQHYCTQGCQHQKKMVLQSNEVAFQWWILHAVFVKLSYSNTRNSEDTVKLAKEISFFVPI